MWAVAKKHVKNILRTDWSSCQRIILTVVLSALQAPSSWPQPERDKIKSCCRPISSLAPLLGYLSAHGLFNRSLLLCRCRFFIQPLSL